MQDAKKKKGEVGYHIYICRRIKEMVEKKKRRQLMMPVIRVEEDRARKRAFS